MTAPNTQGSRTSWDHLRATGAIDAFFEDPGTPRWVKDLLYDTRRDLTLLEDYVREHDVEGPGTAQAAVIHDLTRRLAAKAEEASVLRDQLGLAEEMVGRLRTELAEKYADVCNAAADDYASPMADEPVDPGSPEGIEAARRQEMLDAADFSLDQAATAFTRADNARFASDAIKHRWQADYWTGRASVYATLAVARTHG